MVTVPGSVELIRIVKDVTATPRATISSNHMKHPQRNGDLG